MVYENKARTQIKIHSNQKSMKKRFRIKYEDRHGDCHIEVIYAYNKVDAGRRLSHSVKEVYWIKEESEPNLPTIKKA